MKSAGFGIDAVAGEGAGRLLNILLAVIPLAEGEQFHEFAGEIFIRMTRLA